MPYARYGKVFKQLRKQRKISMDFFGTYGIYKSAIHSFETGKSMMSFERVDVALQAMNVGLVEYEHFINNFQPDYLESIIEEIVVASLERDNKTLKKIQTSTLNSNHFLLSVAAHSCYENVEQDDINEVINYLYEIDNWGYYEISLFYLTLDQFSERDIMHLMKDFWKRGRNSYGIFKYRRRFMEASFRAVVLLSSKGSKESAEKIMKETYFQKDIHDIYIQILRRLAIGFFEQCFGDKEKGIIKCEHYLALFDELDYHNLADYYRLRQNKLLPN